MAQTKSATESTSKTAKPVDDGTAPLPRPNADQATLTQTLPVNVLAEPEVEYGERKPVPGDPSTEPVATGAQSHVDGRVGPPTFAQDNANAYASESGVEQIKPGDVRPADTPAVGPQVEIVEPEARETVHLDGSDDHGNFKHQQPSDAGAGRRV